MIFLDLPEDIRAAICVYISPEDLLSLKQTCRGLHAFGCTDYVWHQMKVDLPLDIPSDHDARSLPSAQLQRVIIKALRVEHNWRHDTSCLRQCRRLPVPDDGLILQMQLVTPNCLVYLSRSQISVWNVEHAGYLVASLKTHRTAVMFSAAAQTGSDVITVAVVEYARDYWPARREQVTVYTLVPKEGTGLSPGLGVPHECHSFKLREDQGTVSHVHVCGHIVGAAIAKFSEMTRPPSYEILLINVITGAKWLFDPKLLQIFERQALAIYPNCFVLVRIEQGTELVARAYAFPSAMRFESRQVLLEQESVVSSDFPIAQDNDLLTTKLELFRFPSEGFDFHISTGSRAGVLSNLSIVAFSSELRQEQMRGYVFRIAFQDLMGPNLTVSAARSRVTVQHFEGAAKTSVDKVCVGKTGRRAVWLQRSWDTDEFEVMKSTFSTSPKVGALFPKHLAFPFGPLHTCESLAFDEATGRVAMSLLTGQLYILDY